MIPTSNGNTSPCDPVSSNCVIWQGPEIACINLCKGDTVSTVIAKLAEEVCDLVSETCECNPDLTGLDLSCIPAPPQANPTLEQYLQAIIDYICSLAPANNSPLIVQLPDCLYYQNSQGNQVTSLPIDEYALYLANKICSIESELTVINNAITDIYNKLAIVEACVLPCEPNSGGAEAQVISSCIISGGQLVPASTLLLALETAYCNFESAVGSVADIQLAINATCLYGTSEMLGQQGNFGDLSNWAQSPNSLAAINRNQWLAICDIYNAVKSIQETCCVSDCTAITWGVTYTVNTDINTGLPTDINFNFTSSSVPASYSDCGNSQIVITDANGSQISTIVNAVALSTDPAGATVGLLNSGLILTQSLSAAVTFCATDGVNTCQDTQNITIALGIPCPPNATLTPTNNSIAVQFSNTLGSGYSFQLDCLDASTNAVAGTTIINGPGSSVGYTFTGLAQGTSYSIIATITDTTTGMSTQCDLGLISTTGTVCSTTVLSTSSSGTGALTDLYLGHRNEPGNQHVRHYFRSGLPSSIIVEPAQVQNCLNPLLDFVSASGGDITIDLEYNTSGASTGTSMTYQYSNDMINWVGTNTVATDQVGLVLNTGFSQGTVYIRAFTTCTSVNTTYTQISYDFNTGDVREWQSEAECINSWSYADVCPAGVYINTFSLDCGGTAYTIPGGLSSKNRWYYVGKVQDGADIKYVYAGWNTDGTLAKVVACCDCPAFILQTSGVRVASGSSVTFNIPYLIGDGTPGFTIITPPNFGTIAQDPTDNNSFTYTQNGGAAAADTFEVELAPTIPGDCMSTTFVVQIQIIQPILSGVSTINDSVFMFIDTNSFLTSDAASFGTIATNLKADLITECPTWVGELYVIPTTSSRWLSYTKGLVDDGASIALNALPDWVAITNLPTSWTGGAAITMNCAYSIVMSNATSPDYHDNTLAAGWGAFPNNQPKAAYLNDYEEYADIVAGTEVSAWAQAQGFGGVAPFEDGVSVVYYPITTDDAGLTAAAILQGLGSLYAQMIPPTEYGIKTAVDVSGYLMQGLVPSATNPYQSAVTSGGTNVEGLWTKGVFMYLDQPVDTLTLTEYIDNIAAQTDNDVFKDDMVLTFKGSNGSCPAITGEYLLLAECGNIGNTIEISNTGGALKLGDVVKISGTCYTVADLALTGTVEAFVEYVDCPTCIAAP